MRVGYVQNSPVFGNKEENFLRVLDLIHGATANLLVLPELFATGYAFTSVAEVKDLAEPACGSTFEFASKLSKKTGAVIVNGFAEKDGEKTFNSAMMVYKDDLIHVYRKIHLFNKETLWFTHGDKHFTVKSVNGMNVGMMICFDWMFPESARSLALLGADIIAHPANLVLPYCQDAMITRCLENKVYAITANRLGTEHRGDDRFTFTGKSQVTGCDGSMIERGPVDVEKIGIVEIDVEKARDKKINDYNNVIAGRRVNMYDLG